MERSLTRLALLLGLLASQTGCAASGKKAAATGPDGPPKRQVAADDRSRCGFLGKRGLEVRETAAPGAGMNNVRRVWLVTGVGRHRRRHLVCREVDTNLDGVKDVVRTYDKEGRSVEERADTNHDGRIDTWNVFNQGRLAMVRIDRNHDAKPDEWKTYVRGKLVRARRDDNYDSRPDVWEVYRSGRLERIGVDLDGDQRVDRWDVDRMWKKEREQAARKKREAAEAKRKKRAGGAKKDDAKKAPKKDAKTGEPKKGDADEGAPEKEEKR